MNLGISTYAYTWAVGVPGSEPDNPLSALNLIDIAAENQLQSLQIADNMPLASMDKSQLEKIKTHARKNKIQIEVGTKRLDEANLNAYLKIARFFQSPFLRIIIDDTGYQPGIPTIISIIKNNIVDFEKAEIHLAIENHDRFKARELENIIQKTGSNKVGICLDSVNSLGAGEGIETVTEVLGKYTINLHVKEFTAVRASHKMGFTIEGTPLGNGLLSLSWMLEKINPKCFSAILEQWTPPETNIVETIKKENQWANESIAELKRIIKQ